MQLTLFDPPHISLEEIWKAYIECQRTKRNTMSAIQFEIDHERALVSLYHDINNGTYKIGRSLAFVVDRPVIREIFAADFRDRIVHHLLLRKINPILERKFIYDSYGCRVDKGTHFGIRRIDRFIKQCSHNYARGCYVLKLDIQSFFMSINRELLRSKLITDLRDLYHQSDAPIIHQLVNTILSYDPTQDCLRKGRRSLWQKLPKHKSLFYAQEGHGLPIGNYTSQVFANYYLNDFDHWMKSNHGIRFYGRYVDDFVIVHEDRGFLQHLVMNIRKYLQQHLGLTLHPHKVHLQHYSKGLSYLGVMILPRRILQGRRTIRSARSALDSYNKTIGGRWARKPEIVAFQATVNSYLGLIQHYQTYRLRRYLMLKCVSIYWYNHGYISGGYRKYQRKIRPLRRD